MTPVQDLPYRPCAGMMVINRHGQVFVGKRIDMASDHWQMPQGGIDAGEDPLTAARREVLEEIGTDKIELIYELPDWLTYDLPDHLIGKVWKGKYRGQKQKWFLFQLTGADEDINIFTEHQEFSEWRWLEVSELPKRIVPFKKDIYEILVERFTPYIQSD
ncbi:RNA pyrophosphohydrolase [Sneathiella chinensis]|uniref:RNA pyrophosphohydrolase n=1 Tax=Sneathiella chinensis TaxID=349750 RepID=A0ABQ5U977_9PROT|nr:RNA pyrophosphohydrolase [Sneathiella chinensis]GLQ07872.1 RNA pyrophosphohydrolase [Sneathiella chinensis]